ncbi:MAG: GNAT family N-acetyltransferase [Candidatus Melainabacteria bacterium]|nr:GNAT family N-acetyltransferase [Candidatus Melainabacteria bacterium]
MNICIRSITPEDNAAVAALIRATLTEFNCVGEGFAYADPELDTMYEATVAQADSCFWVLENTLTQEIVGCGGLSRLKGSSEQEAICELQKFYFLPQTRGQGLGSRLLGLAIEQATALGYRRMYLETVPQMAQALHVYRKFGFQDLSGPLGNTGHHRCTRFMALTLGVPCLSSATVE